MNIELEYRAFKFAEEKHRGQLRKYTGEPYIVHPIRVALYAYRYRDLYPDIVAAAFLHDTIEDCGVTYTTLYHEFNPNIARIVIGLTQYEDLYPEYKTLPRTNRHQLNIDYLRSQSDDVRILKGLDRYCNLLDSPLHVMECVSFLRKRYIKESEDIAHKIVAPVDYPLAEDLTDLIEEIKEKIK